MARSGNKQSEDVGDITTTTDAQHTEGAEHTLMQGLRNLVPAPGGPPEPAIVEVHEPDLVPTRKELKRMKRRTKLDKKAAKTESKLLKQEDKARKKEAKAFEKGDYGRVSPSSAKRIIAIAKVVGPVAAPFLIRGAASAREAVDRMRARKLGVPVDDLGRYTGRGAGLHARIAGDAEALNDLRTRSKGRTDQEAVAADQFAEAAEKQLNQLQSAVRAAERMPAARRRAAHKAVDGELSRIEQDLFRRLGV